MASTNKTTNYDLSQYIGTDKPTYLTDYNQDMSKIDAGIHAAKSEADTNADSIGTLSSLTTTAKSNLVAAINEVDADVATNTNNIATNTSNIATNTTNIGTLTNLTTSNKTDLVVASNEINAKVGNLSDLNTSAKSSTVAAINDVLNILNLSPASAPTLTVTGSGSAGLSETNIGLSKNSDNSLFKLYGYTVLSTDTFKTDRVITISGTGLNPSEAYTITGIACTYGSEGTFKVLSGTVGTDGNITINVPNTGNSTAYRIYFPPCLYFNKSFGDTE